MPAFHLKHFEDYEHTTFNLEEAKFLVERMLARGLAHLPNPNRRQIKPPPGKRKLALNCRDFIGKGVRELGLGTATEFPASVT